MSDFTPLAVAPSTSAPAETRNIDHHRSFCAFLADSEDRLRSKMNTAEATLRHIERLEASEVHISARLQERRTDARKVLEDGHREVDRILSTLCLANEYMNV